MASNGSKISVAYERMGIKEQPNGKVTFEKGRDVRNRAGCFLPKFSIPKHNQEEIYKYDTMMKARGRNISTRINHLFVLARLCQMIHKPLKKMNKEDMVKFVASIEDDRKLASETKQTRKVVLKTALKYIHETKTTPAILDFMEIKPKEKKIQPQNLLTKEEVNALIDVCDNPRDKALISLLYETSCRAGELISCRIKHLQFFPEGYAILTIPEESVSLTGVAKTGTYEAVVSDSLPFLKTHLNHHPMKEDLEAPLFFTFKNKTRYKPMEYQALYQIVRKLGRRAGLKKRCYPHLIRHSISTEWAKEGYTAEEINLRSGRAQGSRVAQCYISLTGGDVRQKVLKKKGFIQEENGNDHTLFESIPCWSCGTQNPIKNTICLDPKCNMPLRLEDNQKERFEKVKNAVDVYDTFQKASKYNPKIVASVLEEMLVRIKEMGKSPVQD